MQIKLILSFLLVTHYSSSVEFAFFLEGKEFFNVTVPRKTYWGFWGSDKEDMFCIEELSSSRLCYFGALAIGQILNNPDKIRDKKNTFKQRSQSIRDLACLQGMLSEQVACEDIKTYARCGGECAPFGCPRHSWDLAKVEFYMKRPDGSLQSLDE